MPADRTPPEVPRQPLRHRLLMRLLSLYPPYLGAGIRVRWLDGGNACVVRMKLTPLNRNYFGTHFGGSLYSMCDPFFVLLLVGKLGSGYVVWDKAASIRFRRPGRGTVSVRFEMPDDTVEEIRRAADQDGKVEPSFTAVVVDEAGEIVAEVEKLLYVKRKRAGAG